MIWDSRSTQSKMDALEMSWEVKADGVILAALTIECCLVYKLNGLELYAHYVSQCGNGSFVR